MFLLEPAAKDEKFVFGAKAPIESKPPPWLDVQEKTREWVSFMKEKGISGVVCLLPDNQLTYFKSIPGGLLNFCEERFGEENLLHAPVLEMQLADFNRLVKIVKFLEERSREGKSTVVHCLAGIGRTGHVLAAWLAYSRDLDPFTAMRKASTTLRDPREAVKCGRASEEDLRTLLELIREERCQS
jgi:protein-tyrosine phosphatase